MSRIKDRVTREVHLAPIVAKGYTRKFASDWYELVKQDTKKLTGEYAKKTLKMAHKKGYLCSTMKQYGISRKELGTTELISDFDYRFLRPYNSSFSKWIEDILTTNRILLEHQDVCRSVYYSIVQRNGESLILPVGGSDRKHTAQDVIQLLEEKRRLEIRPSYWKSERSRFLLTQREGRYFLNDHEISVEKLGAIIDAQQSNYIIADPVSLRYPNAKDFEADHTLKFWLANDSGDGSPVLEAAINFYYTQEEFSNGSFSYRRTNKTFLLNLSDGSFTWDGETHYVPGWEKLLEKIGAICESLKQLTYFTMSLALQEQGGIQVVHFDAYPILPPVRFGNRLNDYLKTKADTKKKETRLTLKDRTEEIKNILFDKYVAHFCRKGIRPYMQKIWNSAVKDDLLHTKGAPLHKKIWCWKHGFYSYRLWQYGVNEDNYTDFLTDYDYFWLNRINNDYQKWVNDKTTYRYIMEPCRQYAPKYYFSVFKRDGQAEISRMPDCPDGLSATFENVLALLKQEKKLAFKPSAGTHGDGFYCLAYENESYWVNGEESTADQVIETLSGQKSFYIVTEYLLMHEELRKIYPGSVNTIRVMVVNEHGYDPKIMQTYMRIGSSSTGFTDNVGYGGICAKIEKETGRIYQPQTISKHVFYDCPVHPDTNTEISGYLPNWEELRKAILSISGYLGELEYLGFDVVLTETGVCVLEINIHQDLHKVADFTDEMKEFFNKKIENKRRYCGITD